MLNVDIDRRHNNITVMTLSGEFDLYEKERVLSLFQEATTGDAMGLIFDLTHISFIDSGGVEVLIEYQVRLEKMGKTMAVVVNHNNYLTRKFSRLGVFSDAGIKLFETIEEAEAAIPAA